MGEQTWLHALTVCAECSAVVHPRDADRHYAWHDGVREDAVEAAREAFREASQRGL